MEENVLWVALSVAFLKNSARKGQHPLPKLYHHFPNHSAVEAPHSARATAATLNLFYWEPTGGRCVLSANAFVSTSHEHNVGRIWKPPPERDRTTSDERAPTVRVRALRLAMN